MKSSRMPKEVKLIMNARRVLMLIVLVFAFGALEVPQAVAQTCRWDGTAPICDGECGMNETEMARLAVWPAHWTWPYGSSPAENAFGSPCWFGTTKALCCATPAPTPRQIRLPLEEGFKQPIYALTDSGDLLWYRHEGRGDGSFTWAESSGRKVGNGWNFPNVFSGGDGVIYAIEEPKIDARIGYIAPGHLRWYRHDGWRDGSVSWAAEQTVGNRWSGFKQVFSGGDGVIYAIRDNGDLLWYRHEGRGDGSFAWAEGSGRTVGTGWNFKHVFAGGDGVIYAIEEPKIDARIGYIAPGHLRWYRHDGWRDGSVSWAAEYKTVGNRWSSFKQVFSGGDGVIYAIQDTGDLLWYRHEGRGDGSFTWAEGSGRTVGTGWNFKHVF